MSGYVDDPNDKNFGLKKASDFTMTSNNQKFIDKLTSAMIHGKDIRVDVREWKGRAFVIGSRTDQQDGSVTFTLRPTGPPESVTVASMPGLYAVKLVLRDPVAVDKMKVHAGRGDVIDVHGVPGYKGKGRILGYSNPIGGDAWEFTIEPVFPAPEDSYVSLDEATTYGQSRLAAAQKFIKQINNIPLPGDEFTFDSKLMEKLIGKGKPVEFTLHWPGRQTEEISFPIHFLGDDSMKVYSAIVIKLDDKGEPAEIVKVVPPFLAAGPHQAEVQVSVDFAKENNVAGKDLAGYSVRVQAGFPPLG